MQSRSATPVLRIRIRMFLGLPDPDPSVRGTDPVPDPDQDPYQNVTDPQRCAMLLFLRWYRYPGTLHGTVPEQLAV